jgi:Flp pilus assembly protein TadD
MMRTFAVAAAMVVLLAGPAYSQGRSSQGASGQPAAAKTPMQLIDEQKQRDLAEVERQYERRAKRPDTDAKSDPWRTMRSVDPPQQKR